MKTIAMLAPMLQRFFTERLMRQRQVSPHTMASYRDAFRLLLVFTQRQRHKEPSDLELSDLDADLISDFLKSLEEQRRDGVRTRNARLTAIRSFFRFAAFEEPALLANIQRILAIPYKRQDRPLVNFLSHDEIAALLSAPDRKTWFGRRDHVFLAVAAQTGLRLSELTGLDRTAVALGRGAHVRCHGKGRKERCTPLTKESVALLKAWLMEIPPHNDSIQHLVRKYADIAARQCQSLKAKKVTPHVLRHSAAMELLAANVDSSIIALWLGHESVNSTQSYLHAHLALKQAAMARTTPQRTKPGTFRPGDQLLQFLSAL